jgi:hypothetical protein
LDRDLNASVKLENLAVSSTVTAFGDESSNSSEFQLIDELGIKHQMLKFVYVLKNGGNNGSLLGS